ncbi:MAG: hypothetical protein GF346_04930, partial [Candidatus Eisenbacteria bacterium]|nr:hypothetical protein [Candidatus Latescibacterota bacterium]MBD3301770.1 hypothetical protein [Candidatus Eisenbacteria bacterium]
MHLAGFSGRRCVLLAAALFLCCTGALAGELALETLHRSDLDLDRVIERTDGSFGLLRGGRIEALGSDRALTLLRESQEGQTLFLSEGGSWIGVATHREAAAGLAPTASFRLLDAAGDPAWEIGPTEDVAYAISRQGAVVGMTLNLHVPDRNALRFYTDGGRLAAEVPVPGLLGGRFDADGAIFFAVSASEGLWAFDPVGTERWAIPEVRLFDAAPGGRFVAAIAGDELVTIRDEAVSA